MEPTLTFDDALKIAKGCTDYGGGYHCNAEQEIYQHGILTVITALNMAKQKNLTDTQTKILHQIGSNAI